MNALELIQRIVTAKQGDAIGSQVALVAADALDECNGNALAYIRAELQALQAVDWDEVSMTVERLDETLEEAGVEPRW